MLLADLSNDLADAKLETANLKFALAESLEEKSSIKKSFNQKLIQAPTLSNGTYAFKGEEGLFCTACFDTTQKKVRVAPLSGALQRFGKWRCPACKATQG